MIGMKLKKDIIIIGNAIYRKKIFICGRNMEDISEMQIPSGGT
jgi:hypothetical protein